MSRRRSRGDDRSNDAPLSAESRSSASTIDDRAGEEFLVAGAVFAFFERFWRLPDMVGLRVDPP